MSKRVLIVISASFVGTIVALGVYVWWNVYDREVGSIKVGPIALGGCDQSATTTDCLALSSLPQVEPQSYTPPSVEPFEEWTSATNTPVTLLGFSFILPPGWHGSVYEYPYGGGMHALVQRSTDTRGFSIACPPSGKGLEAATQLSTEDRLFESRGAMYTISFEEWTSPGNDPWIFVIVRPLSDNPPTSACVVRGASTDPEIVAALRQLYETWR